MSLVPMARFEIILTPFILCFVEYSLLMSLFYRDSMWPHHVS